MDGEGGCVRWRTGDVTPRGVLASCCIIHIEIGKLVTIWITIRIELRGWIRDERKDEITWEIQYSDFKMSREKFSPTSIPSNDQTFSNTAKIGELASIRKKKIIQKRERTRRHPLEEPFLSITGKVNDRKDEKRQKKRRNKKTRGWKKEREGKRERERDRIPEAVYRSVAIHG